MNLVEKIKYFKAKDIKNFSDLKEYKVLTDPYRFTIEDFINSKRFDIQPFFQRNYVWDEQRQIDLIETILFGMPIPAIYTYLDKETGKEVVIDGQQRLTTIRRFLNDVFALSNLQNYSYLNGYTFFSLPEDYKKRILNYKLDIVNIKNINDERIIFDIFRRYNTGGLKLNNQEIRNCIYSGRYNELIKKLADYKPFEDLCKKTKTDRMQREELVLRFDALYSNPLNYKGDMSSFLNNHYEAMSYLDTVPNKDFEQIAKNKELTFKKAIDACNTVFGCDAFKTAKYTTSVTMKQAIYILFSKSVFDMQMITLADIDYALITRHAQEIKKSYETLILNNKEYTPLQKKRSRKAVFARIEKWKEIINNIIY